ncbi:uncharacterized protein EV154DRAFT_446886, partial [Mucor mucedo]|uniref:uncharacterized protein n=1 Tax=Mucor mucedo TaxID=29922 RepID=UPI00221FAA97
MSSQQDGNADTDILPLKWKPGTDHVSKLLLNDPNVMNLIVRSLVGEIAPENSYTVAPTEWADNSRSDVLYTPRAEVTKTMPPILIVTQYLVDQEFMLRLIRYASSTYDRYRVLPLILVIVTKGFSSTTFRREFTVSSNGFLLEASCLFWAKQCLLLSAESINGHLNQATLDPMVALGYLFTNHPSCQMPPQHQANSTLMMLYSVAREILSKEESTKSEKANLIYRLEKAKRDFETILDSDDSQGSNKNKVRQSAEDGIMLIEKMQKDLE